MFTVYNQTVTVRLCDNAVGSDIYFISVEVSERGHLF